MSKKIAIIGAGISGLSIAYQLLEKKHKVVVYEKGKSLSQTSSSSSKLLHGGIRYLENFQFSMVKEALQERKWWRTYFGQ
jgi:glycerol-3-phosphate dehydrogenase